jgi:hypothetical protein
MLAACGGDGDGDGDATEAADEAPAEVPLSVRVTAEQILGCTEALTRSGLDVGVGSQLTVKNEDGTVIGADILELTDGAASCDWSTAVFVRSDAEFYAIEAGGELATVSRSDLEENDWQVSMRISITGTVDRT